MRYFANDNPILNRMIEYYFGLLEKENQNRYKGCLSIILLGSLSRGEGSWIEDEFGLRMVSDLEFFTVYPKGFSDFERFEVFLQQTAEEVFSHRESELFHVDNSYIRRDFLKRMERKLLVFDAKALGKNVVGNDVTALLPEITVKNINLEDIRDILVHRLVSVLMYGRKLKKNGKYKEYRYSLAKNSLDLMTVLLVENGILISGFDHRLQELMELEIDSEIKRYYQECLCIKYGKDNEYAFSIEEMENRFIEQVRILANHFEIPAKNYLYNARFMIRRRLGRLKRAFQYRHWPRKNQLDRLMDVFVNDEDLSNVDLLDNLVLNGYPEIAKISSWSEC